MLPTRKKAHPAFPRIQGTFSLKWQRDACIIFTFSFFFGINTWWKIWFLYKSLFLQVSETKLFVGEAISSQKPWHTSVCTSTVQYSLIVKLHWIPMFCDISWSVHSMAAGMSTSGSVLMFVEGPGSADMISCKISCSTRFWLRLSLAGRGFLDIEWSDVWGNMVGTASAISLLRFSQPQNSSARSWTKLSGEKWSEQTKEYCDGHGFLRGVFASHIFLLRSFCGNRW